MFTGIIENTGIIREISNQGTNWTFWVESPLANELKVDQSLSHSGVCLTIEEIKNGMHRVTAIDETILKTTLGNWEKGTVVNLERCMQLNGRLDGHIVQGHVDCTAECFDVVEKEGSREYRFCFSEQFAMHVIEKGSITINGISLTVFNISNNAFTVAIIPYTYEHTNIRFIKKGDAVNIEFDVIGKYVNRIREIKNIT
ncbi:MAG TPA: riboflavin synthase [Ferruginibacter sp.]|nr:riboflavin synthase [Ferruginibacter sp.]